MLTKKDNETLQLVTETAIKGEMCPDKVTLARLAEAGKIRVEVYIVGDSYMRGRTTYRIATLLTGPHAGKITKGSDLIKQHYEPTQVLDIRPTKEIHKLGLIAPSDKRSAAERAKVTMDVPDWAQLKK